MAPTCCTGNRAKPMKQPNPASLDLMDKTFLFRQKMPLTPKFPVLYARFAQLAAIHSIMPPEKK